jgi:hypothetical protein
MGRIANNPRGKDGLVEVFSMFITVNGKRIYRKNGKPFHFWAKPR